jgi:hypothetical protein
MVGGYQHAGSKKVLNSCYTQRPIGYSVRAAILDLEAGRTVMKAVNHDLVIKVPAFDNIFM